jgi:NAD(P)-dependent dehydrogenase (short-subunit alcohol dehydrogenase family)
MKKRVLITSGASEIRRKIAREFVADSATVCVCDIDTPA